MQRSAILYLLFVIVSLAGCTPRIFRTGTLCFEKIETANFVTNNHIEIKQDIVDALRDQLRPMVIRDIRERTQLKIAPDCTKTDFTLLIRITEVNSTMKNREAIPRDTPDDSFTRSFEIGTATRFIYNKEQIFTDYYAKEQKEKLDSTLSVLSDKIVMPIRYLKKTKPKPASELKK